MISYEQAHQIVLAHTGDFGMEEIPLHQAINRVLREDWHADRDMPPYDRVTMDGIAILYNPSMTDGESLLIEEVAAAGEPQKSLLDPQSCIEVMTGSILPRATDTVIRYEDVTIHDGIASIHTPIKKGQNIHRKGEDKSKGDVLLSAGIKLSPSEIGVGATIGKKTVKVSRFPKTMIISTGDELVEIDEQPLDHQIRKSNVYRIAATLQHVGMQVDTAHVKDDFDEIIEKLERILNQYNVVVLSGGVSMGKFDFLPQALEKLGVKKLFHKVSQRPGKPFWFGQHPNGCTVFALPGNPVSSFMCTQVYLMDWLNASMGLKFDQKPTAVLLEDVMFPKDLTYFLEVKISYGSAGEILAQPQKGHGSGDLTNLMLGDAFILLPRGQEVYTKGECFPVYFYR